MSVKSKVFDILNAPHISSNIVSDGPSPVAAYVAELANQLEGSTSKTEHITQSLIKGKTQYETAAVLPNRSLTTKILHFNFEGTVEDFNKGIGTTCQVVSSRDEASDAKLLLLESTLVEKSNTAPFPVRLKIHGQTTNTEFLYSNQLGQGIQQRADGDDGSEDSFTSAIIQGHSPFSMAVDVPIYDRKRNLDFEELESWIGFKMDNLNSDILDVIQSKNICIVRHSIDEPSPIVMVLDHSKKAGQINAYDNQPCVHDGQNGCILSLSNVKWALEHIKAAYDITPFTNFDEIKATIEPLSGNGAWSSPLKSKAKDKGILDAINGLSLNDKTIRVSAVVKNSYVVCNNVADELASAIGNLSNTN